MTKESLKKLLEQIKKYSLEKSFTNVEDFKQWLSSLNEKQVYNFNFLDVDLNEIKFDKSLLIDNNLLECDDYQHRVNLMIKLKNGEGCWHLYDRLCSPNFLHSKNYYKDMAIISKAPNIRYALWVINESAFINSPYHDEDLKAIVEAKDKNLEEEDKKADARIAEALANVAMSEDSIKSKYHREHVKMISEANSECLQSDNSFPQSGMNLLALNPESLNDENHLENMRILSEKPLSGMHLFNIMTEPTKIKGKYYKQEIEALRHAKSFRKACAMHKYMTRGFELKDDSFNNSRIYEDYEHYYICDKDTEYMKGYLNPKYIEYLNLLNEIVDENVILFEKLLSNAKLYESGYQEHDIKIMCEVFSADKFADLYTLMTNEDSLKGRHHKEDVQLAAEAIEHYIRKLLIQKATIKASLETKHHREDMEYLSKIREKELVKENYLELINYLLYTTSDDIELRKATIERLEAGEKIEKCSIVSKYIDDLLNKIENTKENDNIDQLDLNPLNKVNQPPKSKILSFFKRKQ